MSRLGSAGLAAAVTTVLFGAVAVPNPVVAAPSAVSVEASTLVYTVENGDFLFGIAMKLNVRVTDLLAVNQLTITSSIHPGDTLAVPVGGTLPVEAATTPPANTSASAPTNTAVGATTPPAGSTEYVVKRGDYLVRIATANGVTFKALLAANKLTATSPIFPGTKLVLPPATLPIPAATQVAPEAAAAPNASAAPVPESPPPTSTSYVVSNGDYLVGIAASHGVTLKALLAANTMTAGSAIFPGTRLVIPPATLPIPASAAPVPSGAASVQPANISTMVAFLQGELGKPYLFNSAGPDSYDCSGLVVAAYKQIGIDLPHQSLLQSQKGTNVDWRAVDVQAGDLIFQIGTGKTYISHVGIAINSTQWVQSARAGDVVKIGPIPIDAKIQAVRRIVN